MQIRDLLMGWLRHEDESWPQEGSQDTMLPLSFSKVELTVCIWELFC